MGIFDRLPSRKPQPRAARSSKRIPIELRVEMRVARDGAMHTVLLEDLSAGGARLATPIRMTKSDVITLVDMLHYWGPGEQRALLSRCRAALRPGGRLLVREGDPSRRGGARWTRAVEAVVTKLGWNRGPAVRFRPVDELRADLEALGFRVRIDEVAGRTHPGNVLFVCDAT